MELRILRYFLAVAREENISKAAEYLCITQPTLSRQLIELENELGCQLLNRGTKGQKITLTSAGILLRQRALEIINLADKTQALFNQNSNVISGDIYIGGGETKAFQIIARIAKKLQEQYPLIRYHLYSGNAEDVGEKLNNGLLDFGIIIEPADIKKYNYLKLPAKDTWGLLMHKNSPLASKSVIEPKDILNIPLITSRQTLVRNEISGWCEHDFDKLNIVASYNLVYNASLMVEENFGYALCLDKLINVDDSSSLCFRPLHPKLESSLAIVWKKDQVFSPAATKFLELLKLEIAEKNLTETNR